MKIKLKTLKDLERHYDDFDDEYINNLKDFRFINLKELKAEAVKWVKELRKQGKELIEDKTWNNFAKRLNTDMTLGSTSWIKHFFNVTEEDLIEVEK